MDRDVLENRHRLALLSGKLHGLSPLEKISRGFGFVTGEDGKRIDSVKSVKEGDPIQVQLADGKLISRVTDVTEMDSMAGSGGTRRKQKP